MKKLMGLGSVALTVLVVALFGNLIYMNLRPSDPILPGWEEFDEAKFTDRLNAGEPMLMEIYASWCPTCLAQHKAFETMVEEGRQPNIRAIRLDFDRDASYRETLGINYTGVLVLFENGKMSASQGGLVTPDKIEGFLKRYGYAANGTTSPAASR